MSDDLIGLGSFRRRFRSVTEMAENLHPDLYGVPSKMGGIILIHKALVPGTGG